MNYYDVKRFGLLLALQTEVEGMKAENMIRQHKGESPAYDDKAFADMVFKIESVVYKYDDQL